MKVIIIRPSGSIRVRRGGGWNYLRAYAQVAVRFGYNPGNRDSDLGLRLILVMR